MLRIWLSGEIESFGGEAALRECYHFDMGPVSSADDVGERYHYTCYIVIYGLQEIIEILQTKLR